jgi:hypothetical protein
MTDHQPGAVGLLLLRTARHRQRQQQQQQQQQEPHDKAAAPARYCLSLIAVHHPLLCSLF